MSDWLSDRQSVKLRSELAAERRPTVPTVASAATAGRPDEVLDLLRNRGHRLEGHRLALSCRIAAVM